MVKLQGVNSVCIITHHNGCDLADGLADGQGAGCWLSVAASAAELMKVCEWSAVTIGLHLSLL